MGNRKNTPTMIITGVMRISPSRVCARRVTGGDVFADAVATGRSARRDALLELGRDRLRRGLTGEHALDALPHGVVELVGGQHVDVVAEVTGALCDLGRVRDDLGEERRRLDACGVDG